MITWMEKDCLSHLNKMRANIHLQVSLLQKLSTENAELVVRMKISTAIEERQRIARELHDAVSQQLFAISMMTAALMESEELTGEKIKSRIYAVDEMAGNAQNEMRALLMQLRPVKLQGIGLKEGLENLLTEFSQKHSIQIRWELDELSQLSSGVQDHLFRIVQEGISNVLRHSRATSLFIRLSKVSQQVYLKMVDNGIGFDSDALHASSSYGIALIRERANELGGVAEITSVAGEGTQIEVRVPILGKIKGDRRDDTCVTGGRPRDGQNGVIGLFGVVKRY